MRLSIFEAMSRPHEGDNADQILWFVIDELGALGAIDDLKSLPSSGVKLNTSRISRVT
jgi:hypothetical protein